VLYVCMQVAKDPIGIQVDQSWTAMSLDASMNSSKPVNNCSCVPVQ